LREIGGKTIGIQKIGKNRRLRPTGGVLFAAWA
jgi:hypothetical protein